MSRLSRAPAVAVLAGAMALLPDSSGAQTHGRFAVTPGLDVMFPGSYYANEFEGERSASEVRIRQKQLTLVGAQLSYALPGTALRVGLGYARGESDLKVFHYVREGALGPPDGPPSTITQYETRYRLPATRQILTLAATSQLASGPLALDITSAVIHQQLDATVYRYFSFERVEDRYSDWGLQLGASAGPSSGPARGLRIGARMHLLRTSPEMYEVFRSASSEPEAEADLETAFTASLGWRVTF